MFPHAGSWDGRNVSMLFMFPGGVIRNMKWRGPDGQHRQGSQTFNCPASKFIRADIQVADQFFVIGFLFVTHNFNVMKIKRPARDFSVSVPGQTSRLWWPSPAGIYFQVMKGGFPRQKQFYWFIQQGSFPY